ncbi:MAG: hypothetical protein EPO21_14380 [Chloroflexota bacterium]|nr:MAG: hypothetical protein EPO21_14380 [Chloroflexota bacterium]
MALVIAEGPQLPDEETKRAMISSFTDVIGKYLGLTPREVVILIREEGGNRMSSGQGDILGWRGKLK